MDRWTNLAIKILFLCLKQKSSIRISGQNFLKKQVLNMLFQLPSIMMVLRCIKQTYLNGIHMIWVPSGI